MTEVRGGTRQVFMPASSVGWFLAAAPWVVCGLVLILWQVVCDVFSVPDYILPPPNSNPRRSRQYGRSHLVSCKMDAGDHLRWVRTIGRPWASHGGRRRLLPDGLCRIYPLLIGFNSVPKVAVVPILVVWFGIGAVPAVLTAFLMSFFPIVVNVATGLATVEPELEDVLRALGAKKRDLILKVGLPRSLPYFFASLKIAITLAFVGSVISESIASSRGIGTLMVRAASDFRISLVFAGLIVTAAMGIIMYVAFAILEWRMTGWAVRRPEVQ